MSNDDQTPDPDGPDIAQCDDTAHEQLIADRRAVPARVADDLPADTGRAPAEQGSLFETTPTYLAPVLENLEQQLAQAAPDLHMQAREVSPLGPWVVVGTIDGRAFYLRERGEQYAIVIAADDTPTLGPPGPRTRGRCPAGRSYVEAQRLLRAGPAAGNSDEGGRRYDGHERIPEAEFGPASNAEQHVRYLLAQLPNAPHPLGISIVGPSGEPPSGLDGIELEDVVVDYADGATEEVRDETTAIVLVDVSGRGRLAGWLSERDSCQLLASGGFVERYRADGAVQVASVKLFWFAAEAQVRAEINDQAEMADRLVLVVSHEP